MMNKLERIIDEIEVGLKKLDEGEYWTCNSHPLSLLGVSLCLFHLGCVGIFIDLYYSLKFKVYWRIKYRRILR